MKIFTVILILTSFNAFSAELNSVEDSPALMALFEEVELTVEAAGAFIVEEDFFYQGDLDECDIVPAKRVREHLDGLGDMVDEPSLNTVEAHGDFAEIIGRKKYYRCVETGSVQYYDFEKTSFIATDFSYRVQFEMAWEN